MCMVCVEVMKGKLTAQEALRNSEEFKYVPHTPEEIKKLGDYIKRERPDFIKEVLDAYHELYKNNLTK